MLNLSYIYGLLIKIIYHILREVLLLIRFDISKYTHQQIQNTRDVLNSIAYHLSSKSACRQCVYTIVISDVDIHFDIGVRLCRVKGDPKSAEPVIWHIVGQHFTSSIFRSIVNNTTVGVIPNTLVPGVYVYKNSVGNKQRRWFKDVDY